MPMSSPTPTAMGRLRIFAAMTAANAAATSRVKLPASSPMPGAARTPVNPAKKTLTAHTPAETSSGLCRQVGHCRRVDHCPHLEADLGVAQDDGTDDHGRDHVDVDDDLVERDRHAQELVDVHGLGASPGAWRIAPVPKITVAIPGMVTSSPMVATTLMSGERNLRNRKRIAYSTIPIRGAAIPMETIAVVAIDQFLLGVEVVVEAGDEEGHRSEREFKMPDEVYVMTSRPTRWRRSHRAQARQSRIRASGAPFAAQQRIPIQFCRAAPLCAVPRTAAATAVRTFGQVKHTK